MHLCGKLRNRLLSPNVRLLIGDPCASVDHLLEIVRTQSKIDHGLVISDICVKDKQNYASCEKVSSDAVLLALKQIPASEATQFYIQVISQSLHHVSGRVERSDKQCVSYLDSTVSGEKVLEWKKETIAPKSRS